MKNLRFRYRQIHVSWLIAAVCGGFLAGVALSLIPATAGFASSIWLFCAVGLALLAFAKRQFWMIFLAVMAGLLCGLWRGMVQRVDLTGYANFLNRETVVTGVIAEDPTYGNSGELKIRIKDVVIDDVALPGQVWISASAKIGDVRRSDHVEIHGKLKPGFGTFPASMTYAALVAVERSPGDDPARDARDWFGENLRKAVSNPESDLGMGILAGQKTALPATVSDAFRVAGLTHIVVASGYNLTILVRFARRLFGKVSRFAALSGAGIMVFAFACVTGFSPSMSRAALVAGLSLLAWYYGRKFHPIVLLLLVAAGTVMVNPLYIWGDVGWYMSFAAFAGVIILAPLVHDYFWGAAKKPGIVRQTFIDTMSAQILTAPIIALFMGQFALYGLLANLLVLPLVPLTMLLTFFAGIAGWILPANLAQIAGWPAEKLLAYIIEVAENVSGLPGASQEVDFGIVTFVICAAAILAAIIFLWRKTKHDFRGDNLVE